MRAPRFFLAAVLCACSSGEEGDDAATSPLEPTGTAGSSGGTGAAPVGGAAGNAGAPGGGTPSGGSPGAGAPAAAGAAGTSAAPSDAPAEPPPPTGPLPDLTLDAGYLIDTTIEDRIETDDQCLLDEGCVTGLGERRVVRFGSRMGNLGTAPLELGAPGGGNPAWNLDSCHEAYELTGFARYELVDAATGQVVLTGAKNGYCIRDSEPWPVDVANINCYSYECGGQGITPGCADNYGSELECQWIDITGVAAGSYTLQVVINANRAVPELDYTNNGVNVNLQISDTGVVVLR